MASEPAGSAHGVRYEPDEKPPWPLAAGLALQSSVLAVGGVVLTVAIVLRSAESSAGYLAWGAFGALLVSGVATIVQAWRVGRLGSGYVLMMGCREFHDDPAQPVGDGRSPAAAAVVASVGGP